MLKKSAALVFTIVVVALFLLSSFSSLAAHNIRKAAKAPVTTPKSKCSETSDADIVKAIKEHFQADPDISSGMDHLNVSVRKRTVKLEGWLSDKTLIAKAVNIARRSPCVKRVINKIRKRGGTSCGPGQRPCGGICIDKSSACNN